MLMAKQLIECVPNFSEGINPEVIEAIVDPFRHQNGCYLLDYRADQDHNRLHKCVAVIEEIGPSVYEYLDELEMSPKALIDESAEQLPV